MPDLEIEPGLTIHYLDQNPSGYPVVLLLHGLGATGDSWQLQFPPLIEAGYRVLAPDMRGFGRSNYPGGSNKPETMAADTAKFLQMLEISKCHLIGLSMGGTIALQLVLKNQNLAELLILTNTFAKLRPTNVSNWIFYGIRLILVHILGINKQATYVASRLFPHPEQEELRSEFTKQVRQANQKAYRSTMRSYARYDLTDHLGEIDIPTLIITGENDTVVPPAVQAELVKRIPYSNQIIVPNTGHAVTVEQPDIYNNIVLDFLNST